MTGRAGFGSRLGFGIVMMMIIIILSARVSAAFKYTSVGMQAHEFSGQDLVSGEKVSLRDLYRDNLVIVVFWATWSPRSLVQLEEMKTLKSQYTDHPIEIIAVNVDAPELSSGGRIAVLETVKGLDLPFPAIIDDGLEIFYTYGVIAVPSTAIIDTSGALRYDPGGYGMLVRDIIEDSVKLFIGLSPDSVLTEPPEGYEPQKKSARYYGLALNLKKTGMYERALSNLDLAQQADTLFAAPHALRGEILLLLERFDEADTAFAHAVALDSNGVAIWAGWGRTLMHAGQTQAARTKLSHALSINDSYTPALIDIGLCLAHQDSLEAAIDSLNRAVELNPGDIMVYYYLGQVYRRAGQEGEAAVAYTKALSIIFPPD
jgi:Flp pilus assembly protein TadD/peroxiredoxin